MSMKDILKAQLGDDFSEEKFTALLAAAEAEAKSIFEKGTEGLKTNQTKLLDQMAKLKDNQLPEGFDNDAFNSYIKEKDKFETDKKELEDKRLANEGQWDALKNNLIAKHEGMLEKTNDEKDSVIGILRKSLDKELIENAAIKAIEKEKGNSFFLLPHMKNNIKTVLIDDVYSAHVVDAEGNPRLNDKGEAFTVPDLVAEMKSNEQFAPAFPGRNAGGGGGPNPGSGGGSVVNPWKSDTKNITAQAKMNKENPTLASQMKKAAGL